MTERPTADGSEGPRAGQPPQVANPLFTFDTTHMALWAEEVAREGGIPAETVPAPPETRARCGLALETLDRFVGPLSDALSAAGVSYYTPGRET